MRRRTSNPARGEPVRHVERLRTADALEVLGRLLLEDVGDVVLGDDAEQMVLIVDDRQRQEVLVDEQIGRRLLVGIRSHADGIGDHDLADRGLWSRQHQIVQGEDAEQALLGVDYVDIIYRFGFLGDAAQEHDGVVGTHVRGDGDEGRRHPAAGGIGRIGGELPNLGGFVRLHRPQNLLAVFGGQFGDDVGGVVRVDRLEEIGGFLAGAQAEDGRGVCRVQLLQNLRDFVVRDRLEEDGDLVFVEPHDDVGPVGWSEAVGQTADAELFALGDQVTDFVEQLVRGHGRAKPREDCLRFVRSQKATPRGQFDVRRGVIVAG